MSQPMPNLKFNTVKNVIAKSPLSNNIEIYSFRLPLIFKAKLFFFFHDNKVLQVNFFFRRNGRDKAVKTMLKNRTPPLPGCGSHVS